MTTPNLPQQIATVEQRLAELPAWAERNRTRLKWGLGFVACVVLAPIAWTGVVGLAGLAVFTALAGALAAVAPAASKYAVNKRAELIEAEANRHLKALRAEASRNPVETLWTRYKEDVSALERRREALVELDGKARTFGSKVDDFKRRFSSNVPQLAKYEDRHRKMMQVIEVRRAKLQRMNELLGEKKQAIEMAEGIWGMALASREFDAADQRDAEAKFYSDFKEQTAFDAIETAWNTTGAEFDQMMAEEVAEFRPSRTLGFNPSEPAIAIMAPDMAKIPMQVTRKETS